VRVTGVPFNAFATPAAVSTGSDGSAAVALKTTSHLTPSCGAALYVAASKDGDVPLAGVSASRLVKVPVG
jgi:hypothetical protein